MKTPKRPMMRWSLCQCEINGLKRPTNGPLRIKSTEIVGDGVLKANLSGPGAGVAHTVKVEGKFYYVAPGKKGVRDIREMPADSLTDALHAAVWTANEEIKHKKKMPIKKRPMPHVSVSKINQAAKAGKKR